MGSLEDTVDILASLRGVRIRTLAAGSLPRGNHIGQALTWYSLMYKHTSTVYIC